MISVAGTICDKVAYKKIDLSTITISDNECRNKLRMLH